MSRPAAILKSSDIAATADWYLRAGFDVRVDGTTWCEVARDGLVLQFLAGATPWAGPPGLTGCVYVHVDDVDAVAAQLHGRVDAEWGVEDRDWGSRELVLRDPDGYVVTFTAPGATRPTR